MADGLTYTDTMRCNKQQIQQEMKAASSREELSSIFAFHDQLTLVSYVPKPGKAVIVLSSMHHDKKVDGELKNLKLFFTTMLQRVVLIISIILTSVNDNKIRQLKAQFSLAVYSSSQKMNFLNTCQVLTLTLGCRLILCRNCTVLQR